jgi:hypothetical protein
VAPGPCPGVAGGGVFEAHGTVTLSIDPEREPIVRPFDDATAGVADERLPQRDHGQQRAKAGGVPSPISLPDP